MFNASIRQRSISRDESGNVGIIFALMIIPILGITGLAVDYGRTITARSQLQNATDSAALAAVRLIGGSEQDRMLAAQKAFAVNYNGTGSTGPITPAVTLSGSSVTVTAQGSVPTPFASFAGMPTLQINAASGATMAAGKHLELSMMIDLTGSMGQTRNGQTKITGLKDASADLLSILLTPRARTAISS